MITEQQKQKLALEYKISELKRLIYLETFSAKRCKVNDWFLDAETHEAKAEVYQKQVDELTIELSNL